jgi:hypothetical protein
MHSAVKLIIGIIVLLLGLYWYAAPLFGHMGIQSFFGASTFQSFVTVFAGVFGVFLIFVGLIVAWIEWEDLKWQAREKAEKAREAVEEKEEVAKPKKRGPKASSQKAVAEA